MQKLGLQVYNVTYGSDLNIQKMGFPVRNNVKIHNISKFYILALKQTYRSYSLVIFSQDLGLAKTYLFMVIILVKVEKFLEKASGLNRSEQSLFGNSGLSSLINYQICSN